MSQSLSREMREAGSYAAFLHEGYRAARQRLWRRPLLLPAPLAVEAPVGPPEPSPEPCAPVPFNFLLRPSWRAIVKLVALKHRVAVSAIIGPQRVGPVMSARHEAAFLIYTHCGLSLQHIGNRLGGRDHTSIYNSIKVVKALRKSQGLPC